MICTRILVTGMTALLMAGLVGCQQPEVDMSEMMQPPTRPAELDRLDMFLGTWEGSFDMKMAGMDEAMTSTGTNTVTWEADDWVLVERMESSMGDEGTMKGIGLWTWDAKAKKYRTWWFDNYGGVYTGTARYDEDEAKWHMTFKTSYSATGAKTVGEGTSKMLSDGTMEWNYTEWDSLRLKKIMEGKGISRRK